MLESNRGSGCKSTEKEETKEKENRGFFLPFFFNFQFNSRSTKPGKNLASLRKSLVEEIRSARIVSFSALPSLSLFARRHSAPAGFLRRAKLVSRTARGETTRGEYVTTIISGLKWGLISFGAGGGEEGRRWRRRSRSGDGGVGCVVGRAGWDGARKGKCVYTPAEKHAASYTA